MSEAIAFDTHRFVKHLTENGFTEQQAEVLADEQVHLLNTNLATQADIAAIHQDIDALRQETKADIAAIHQAIDALRQETKADIAAIHQAIDALRQETKANIDALRQETKANIDALRQETKANIDALRQETKADIAEVQRDIEALRQETKVDIAGVQRDIEALRQETKTSIAGVQRDIEALRRGTKVEIETLRLGTQADLADIKSDLLKWVMGGADCPGWGGGGAAQIAPGLRPAAARFRACPRERNAITSSDLPPIPFPFPPWERRHLACSSSHPLLGGPGAGRATTRVAPTSFIGRVLHMRWWSCSGCSVGAMHELPLQRHAAQRRMLHMNVFGRRPLAVPSLPRITCGAGSSPLPPGEREGTGGRSFYRNVRTSPSRGEGRELVGATLVVAQLPLFFAGSAGILACLFAPLRAGSPHSQGGASYPLFFPLRAASPPSPEGRDYAIVPCHVRSDCV